MRGWGLFYFVLSALKLSFSPLWRDIAQHTNNSNMLLTVKLEQYSRPLPFYHKNPKNSDTPKNCFNYPKIGTVSLYYRVMGPKPVDGMANSVDLL